MDAIKAENDKYARDHKSESAKYQIRLNLYQTHIRRFHTIMNEYNQATHDFKKVLQDQDKRMLKSVDKTLSEEKLDEIIESGKAQEVLKQAMISEDLEDAVRDIEERHLVIISLQFSTTGKFAAHH